MAWSYIKLWKLLLDKGMKRIDLAAAANRWKRSTRFATSLIAELRTSSNTFLIEKQTEAEPQNAAIF